MLGLAVRSVQLMVDRAELEAWRTSGGHRRISRESVTRWLASRQDDVPPRPNNRPKLSRPDPATQDYRILLIEDSAHFQNLVGLLIRQHFPKAALHIASDGISGLAKFGQIQPDLLLVDILLPGIDGAALITTLRSDPQFARSKLIIVTGLDDHQLAPYEFALRGLALIHKVDLVKALPAMIRATLSASQAS